MPMKITQLESQAASGLSITPGTHKAAVLRVLVTEPETAFKPAELAERAEIPKDSAPTVCRRLETDGAVDSQNGHYYLPQDADRADAVRRALGEHQAEMATKTAEADEEKLSASGSDAGSDPLSAAGVDDELTDLEEGVSDPDGSGGH